MVTLNLLSTLHASHMAAESSPVVVDGLYMSKGCGTGGWAPCEFSNVFHIKQRGRAATAAVKLGLDADI